MLKYCATIESVGPIDRDGLLAIASSFAEGATVYIAHGRKLVQIWGNWRDVIRASAVASCIAQATKTSAIMALSSKTGNNYIAFHATSVGGIPELQPANLLTLSEIRKDLHHAVGAPKPSNIIRLYTEWKENLPGLARKHGGTLRFFDEGEAFGVWSGGIEKSAVIDFEADRKSTRASRAARACAKEIIEVNKQSAVLVGIIRGNGAVSAKLIAKE